MVPFEGAEKKCELIVRSDIDLRSLPPRFWHALVAACSAEVLSVVSNDDCEAYLLSESSLFIWTHRMLLITCGRTRMIQSIHHLLDHLGVQGGEIVVEHQDPRQSLEFLLGAVVGGIDGERASRGNVRDDVSLRSSPRDDVRERDGFSGADASVEEDGFPRGDGFRR